MKQITVGQFLKEINPLLIPIKGRKYKDMGDFHKDVAKEIEGFMNDYPEIEDVVWYIRYKRKADESFFINLFQLKMDLKKDKRFSWTAGEILDLYFEPGVPEIMPEAVPNLTLEAYIKESKLVYMDKEIGLANEAINEAIEEVEKAKELRANLMQLKTDIRLGV